MGTVKIVGAGLSGRRIAAMAVCQPRKVVTGTAPSQASQLPPFDRVWALVVRCSLVHQRAHQQYAQLAQLVNRQGPVTVFAGQVFG